MFGSTLIAILVFGCMLAITIMGLLKSNATARRLNASGHPSGAVYATPGTPVRNPDMRHP